MNIIGGMQCGDKGRVDIRWGSSHSWRGGDRQNDWVWLMQRPGIRYGMLNGRLPWQLQPLFKINLIHDDGALIQYWLSLAWSTIPENLGNVDVVSKFE